MRKDRPGSKRVSNSTHHQRAVTCDRCGVTELRWIELDSPFSPGGRRGVLIHVNGVPHACVPKVKVFTKEEIAKYEKERKK